MTPAGGLGWGEVAPELSKSADNWTAMLFLPKAPPNCCASIFVKLKKAVAKQQPLTLGA